VEGIWFEDVIERVRLNQSRLSSEMKSQYDFIICGSGSSGSETLGAEEQEHVLRGSLRLVDDLVVRGLG
jgi:hypothetical protein